MHENSSDLNSKNKSATNPLIKLWVKLLRFGFFLLYNDFAFTYDTVSWIVSLGLWRDWQRAALHYLHGPDILELAHGPGHMLAELNKKEFRVTGIDLSSHMGLLAQKRAAKSGFTVNLVRCPAQYLPFSENSFDSVLSTFPSEFILDKLTLLSVHRVLKQEGSFVIVPSAQFTGSSALQKGIEWLYFITGQRSFPLAQDHQKSQDPHSEGQLKDIFHLSGFNLKIKNVPVQNSKVTLFIAQKIN